MSLTKIWVDCSGGVDDILALIILLDAPDYDVVAISCVRGKTTVDQGIVNVAKVLQVCKRSDIPIYCGSDEPLTTPFPKLDDRHVACENSARSSFLVTRKSDQPSPAASESHASIHMVETAKRMGGDMPSMDSYTQAGVMTTGELVIVSLGPVTNIAVSCILDPLFPVQLGKYVAVGGSEISGDVTQTAEFNFFIDPEAAQLVTRKFPRILLITRTLGRKYVWSIEEEWLERAETAKARLIEGILTVHEEVGDKIEWIGSTAIAAAIVGAPDLVTTSKSARCEIELIGRVTRGQSIFDFGPFNKDSNVLPSIWVVTEIDDVQFHQVLREVIV